MATTDDYRTGNVVEGIKQTEQLLDNREAFAPGDPAFEQLRAEIIALKPVWITAEQAVEVIRHVEIVAVGARACHAIHPESPETQSVFLDELAEVMAGSGKAEIVTVAEAIEVINRQSHLRFIASKVSGKYLKLCAAHLPDCIFCKAEQVGIRCFGSSPDS